MPLTDAKIRTLKPRDKPYKVSDFDGLFLSIRPSGSKLWPMKYRIAEKEKLLSFGAYPAISLAQARSARDDARALLALGEDPGEAEQQLKREDRERRGHTFESQAKAFMSRAIKEGRAPATLAKTDWLLGMANAAFGNKPISEITSPMILQCLRKVEAKGNYETAKRLRAQIGSVFRFAVAVGVAETDPTYALKDALIRPTVKSRAAITEPKALGGLLRAVDAFEGQMATRIALQLMALLAQRPGELRHAEWADIDLEAGIWSIPAERMKMRRPHKVPLPSQAIAVIDELRALTGSGRYLFPSIRSAQRVMSENTLNAALRRMGFSAEEMTSHGFRATFSTLANESGLWNPDAIERALAHVEANQVRRAYARGEHWDERVRLADWWAGYLDDCKTS
ncbi:tyrosine-type recombinase/integrase [Loktanella sp. M215]|uniref:tyrosine-type recombinase/integrase n=1 Tax=Loktanella sp. M215 TaxID=2675431 RepID=UPI001F19DC18|nr:integrase arm-type DNA-binding domain-containing protein [Loktanella sp. M215]MCF7698618.1 tyrosine-type recombinase/integrase [Loktanella sp. M215]